MSQNAGKEGELRGLSANEYSCTQEPKQTPYLTYAYSQINADSIPEKLTIWRVLCLEVGRVVPEKLII
jgi:hypothetical protein